MCNTQFCYIGFGSNGTEELEVLIIIVYFINDPEMVYQYTLIESKHAPGLIEQTKLNSTQWAKFENN